MTKNITFDRFVRGCLIIGSIAVVNFLQNTCHLRWRGLCVIITLLLAGGIVTGLLWLCIPPMIEESAHLKDVVRSYLERGGLPDNATVPEAVRHFFNLHVQKSDLKEYLQSDDGLAQKCPAPFMATTLLHRRHGHQFRGFTHQPALPILPPARLRTLRQRLDKIHPATPPCLCPPAGG